MEQGIVVVGFITLVGTLILIALHFAEKYLDKLIKNRGQR
jgi:hypothetical protein